MRNALSIIREIAPGAAPAIVSALARQSAIEDAKITTPLRLAHFLAQVAVETAGFTRLRESGRYSAKRIVEVFGVGKHSAAVTPAEAKKLAGNEYALFERVYGLGNPKKARELGNIKVGDGYRFRGGGAMHTTGRNGYDLVGLADDPDLIETADHCLRPALDYWERNGCNGLADQNDIRAVTRRINGGYNGYAERVAWFNRLWPLLRSDREPEQSWKVAHPSEMTKLLQGQLVQLGYDLKVDGRYGPATTAAVVAFQRANGLKPDGIAGDLTKSALASRLSITAAAPGSEAVAEPPRAAPPVATGFSLAAIGEGGQRLIDQAGVLQAYAGLSDWVGYGALMLTGAGVGIIAIGVVRSYVIPAIWPATAPVPA
ncbi:peptidoglycan-binding protein [Ancylobacter sp. A5.8]|uniref:peptidoglycan-binding protein n=1 Tax=Ancylobacter gelatini TaxID=2919920 RepID=UPI001F4DE503|nr:peptidoglycan-binding protein [Ancylobacter gelatini]MCJ8142951.1 peptidoglycan-binding protein [Ancylobacter gelatini]